jgi:16S rRNA (cytosine967-C5)-methyltransferase
LSHPLWLAERWLDRLGFDIAEAWMQFNNAPAPLTLRTNTLRVSGEELVGRLHNEDVRVHPGRYSPDALVVDEGHPLRGEGLERGWFVVQDEASQLVARLAHAQPGMRVLDTCASPGGKTTAMAAMMRSEGVIVASDVRDRRIRLLRRTVGASGATNVRIVRADVLRPLPFSEPFDLVVVDAPCSGLGTLRRDPDIRWRRSESDLPALAAAQLTMLQHAGDSVAPGGRLLYSTCSSEPEENEGVVNAFLAGSSDFALLDARVAAPTVPAAVVDDRGCLRTRPDLHQLEAFFGAVLLRGAQTR